MADSSKLSQYQAEVKKCIEVHRRVLTVIARTTSKSKPSVEIIDEAFQKYHASSQSFVEALQQLKEFCTPGIATTTSNDCLENTTTEVIVPVVCAKKRNDEHDMLSIANFRIQKQNAASNLYESACNWMTEALEKVESQISCIQSVSQVYPKTPSTQRKRRSVLKCVNRRSSLLMASITRPRSRRAAAQRATGLITKQISESPKNKRVKKSALAEIGTECANVKTNSPCAEKKDIPKKIDGFSMLSHVKDKVTAFEKIAGESPSASNTVKPKPRPRAKLPSTQLTETTDAQDKPVESPRTTVTDYGKKADQMDTDKSIVIVHSKADDASLVLTGQRKVMELSVDDQNTESCDELKKVIPKPAGRTNLQNNSSTQESTVNESSDLSENRELHASSTSEGRTTRSKCREKTASSNDLEPVVKGLKNCSKTTPSFEGSEPQIYKTSSDLQPTVSTESKISSGKKVRQGSSSSSPCEETEMVLVAKCRQDGDKSAAVSSSSVKPASVDSDNVFNSPELGHSSSITQPKKIVNKKKVSSDEKTTSAENALTPENATVSKEPTVCLEREINSGEATTIAKETTPETEEPPIRITRSKFKQPKAVGGDERKPGSKPDMRTKSPARVTRPLSPSRKVSSATNLSTATTLKRKNTGITPHHKRPRISSDSDSKSRSTSQTRVLSKIGSSSSTPDMSRTTSFVKAVIGGNAKLKVSPQNSATLSRTITSFLKRATPVKNKSTKELAEEKAKKLNEKMLADKLRREEAEREKNEQLEAKKQQRLEREKRAAQTREVQRRELEVKQKQIEERSRQNELAAVLEKKQREEKEKAHLREQKLVIAEERRKREEESRLQKIKAQETEAKRLAEAQARRREMDEQTRKNKAFEQKMLEKAKQEALRKVGEQRLLQGKTATPVSVSHKSTMSIYNNDHMQAKQAKLEVYQAQLNEERQRLAALKPQEKAAVQPLNTTFEVEHTNYMNLLDLAKDDEFDMHKFRVKVKPDWAKGDKMRVAVVNQVYDPPDLQTIFGNLIDAPMLEHIFPRHRPRFFKRTSSAHWNSPPIKRDHK